MKKCFLCFKGIFCSIYGLRAVAIIEALAVIILSVCLAFPKSSEPSLPTIADNSQGSSDSSQNTVDENEGKILYNDATLGEVWLSALPDVPVSDIEKYSFKSTEDGYKYYCDENGEKTSLTGIDISYYQGAVDWQLVKESGIEYAILRIGLRGYETGEIRVDQRFNEYIEGANAVGLPVGVYFFSQAISPEEAKEEALFVIEQLRGYTVDFPVVYDWEIIGESSARTNSVTSSVLTDCAVAFCEEVKAAGFTPMIYTNRSMGYMKLDLSRLTDYDLWIADFNDFPSFYYKYTMWQYSYTGKVNGIDTAVDLNVCFKDYSA